MPEIKRHPWFLKHLPIELMEGGTYQSFDVNNPSQSMEEVLAIIQEARTSEGLTIGDRSMGGSMDLVDDLDDDEDIEDVGASGEFVCPL